MTDTNDAPKIDTTAPDLGPDGKEWAKTAAGYKHVETMVPRADAQGVGPLWYGWALRQSFVAGAEWQEAQSAARTAAAVREMREAAAAELEHHLSTIEDVALSRVWQERIRALPLPADGQAALDRLIAKRVREAVEAALAAVHEADSLELAQHGAAKIAERIETQIAARGSKEGRDG